MEEIWERAVETALDGQTDFASVRTLTLDGAVKCIHGKLPPPAILERFKSLQHLSIANIGVSSLEQFPRLQNLQKLILSDNRIAGGLEFLVDAALNSLRDLDLSNNRIQDVNDLQPLAELKLLSLDLYECPVTRAKDYRSRVFGLIKSLKYLDKTDAEGNERPESDDEEEDDEDDEEDDPGSGEVDGEDVSCRMNNGHHRAGSEGVIDVDEEESDADEEEMEVSGRVNGSKRDCVRHHQSNGFRVEADDDGDDDDEESEDEEDNDSDGEEDDVVEVHDVEDSDDDEEDGVEDDEDDDDDNDDDDEEDEEEVDNEDGDFAGPEPTGRPVSMEGEIDAHEQGEDDGDDDDGDDDGETGEEEQGVEDDGNFEEEDEDEDDDAGYLVQPVGHVEVDEDPDLEEEVEDEEDEDGEVQEMPPSASHKRKRDDGGDGEDDDDDDIVEYGKSSKHR